MPHDTKQGFHGLVTNVAETQAPAGTLIEAENVVMRRPGCIEPRDGFLLVQTLASGFAAYGFSWRAKDFILRNNGANVFDWRDTAGGTYQYTQVLFGAPTEDPQPLRRDIFSRAEARANLYLPFERGVLRMETDAGPWRPAGVIPYASVATHVMSGAGSWLPAGEHVAYRLVCVRTDANGVRVASAPSGAYVATAGGGGAPQLSLVGAGSSAFFDTTEVYRTRNFPTSVTPDEEYQLVASLPSTTSTYLDLVLPAARGDQTLYTSPSRGGMNEANGLPPAAAIATLFRGSLFFANIRRPRQITVSYSATGVRTGSATGLGTRVYTATTTNGNPNLTLLSSTVGLEKGMTITGTGIPASTWITNISGTTVTMNNNATAGGAGVSITFEDAINLDGTWFALQLFAYLTNFGGFIVTRVTPPEGGYANTAAISYSDARATARTIQATHGSEYFPPLPGFDGTPKQIAQDAWPGAVIWSKPDEPEHVRPIDYEFVGDQNRAILGAVATRDALYLLKEDGVFRVTGANGDWRFDPVDPTARIVLPGSALPVRGRCVFLGDRGVAMVSDEGVDMVSAAVNDLVKPVIDQIVATQLSTGFYELPGMQGAHAASVFERESEYTLARGSTVPPLVYNDITQAWTTLAYYGHASESYSYRALFNFGRSGNNVLSLGVSYFKTLLSTDAGADYLRNDRATAVTVNSFTNGQAVLSAAVLVLEDDVIKDSAGRYWRVTSAQNSNVIPVVLAGGTASMATGAGTLYRSLRCSVIATGFTNPLHSQKVWGEFLATFTKFVGPVRARYGWQSSQAPAAFVEEDVRTSLVPLDLATPGTGFASYELGLCEPGRVNRDNMRAWLLRGRIRWAQVHGDVQLEGISAAVVAEPENARSQVKAA